MIKNEKQYTVTISRLKEFRNALESLERQEDIDPLLKKIQIDGVKSQIEDFEAEISEYELARNNEKKFIIGDSFEDFRKAFITARISRGWSQNELAAKVNLKEQQIQRYEANEYSTATLPRIKQISDALQLEVKSFKLEFQDKKYDFSESINHEALERAKRRIQQKKILLEINNN